MHDFGDCLPACTGAPEMSLWQMLPSLSPFVLLLSVGIAWLAFRDARRRNRIDHDEARKRDQVSKSFDHIIEQTRDRDLIEMNEQFKAVIDSLNKTGPGPYGLADVEGHFVKHRQAAIDAAEVITKLFNYYEATAIGISLGALDEEIIKRWWRASYVEDWRDFSAYVTEKRDRDGRPALYRQYQLQAERWT
ncbi:MAG: hypothetical protein CMF73_07860 [Maricaulis sp.]|jgi:hypothetical protein|nr:hypothetical protein [Maricaulis sp.]